MRNFEKDYGPIQESRREEDQSHNTVQQSSRSHVSTSIRGT